MIYSVDCPAGHRVLHTFGLVESTTAVGMSAKSAWSKFVEGTGPTHRDAMENLGAIAPDGANAIVGVRLSTATAVDGDGRILLVLTYIGTPVVLEPPPAMPVASPAPPHGGKA